MTRFLACRRLWTAGDTWAGLLQLQFIYSSAQQTHSKPFLQSCWMALEAAAKRKL